MTRRACRPLDDLMPPHSQAISLWRESRQTVWCSKFFIIKTHIYLKIIKGALHERCWQCRGGKGLKIGQKLPMARSKKVPISGRGVSKIWGKNVDVVYEWSQKLQTQIYVYHEISCKEPKSKLILGQFKNKSWKVPFFVLFSRFFFFGFLMLKIRH